MYSLHSQELYGRVRGIRYMEKHFNNEHHENLSTLLPQSNFSYLLLK